MRDEQSSPHSVRLYSALLKAYPKQFRREYGPQMEQLFRDLYRERRGSRSGLVQLWITALSDLVPTAMVQRITYCTSPKEAVMQNRMLAVIGFVLLFAPLYFVSASLLMCELGVGFLFDPLEAVLSVAGRREVFNLFSPVALKVYAVARFHLGREDGTIVSTVRVTPRLWNIVVAVVSVLLLMTLVGYAFFENFAYRP
jgi:hypothetical protein